MKLQRYDKDAQRIVDKDNKIIAMALRLGNGKWSLFDKNEVRISKKQHISPRGVLKEFSNV